MTCPSGIIFHNENTGTDGDPIMEAYVSCDEEKGACGFSVPFHDDEGTKHDAYDFWVTSDDFRRYEELHLNHTAISVGDIVTDTHSDGSLGWKVTKIEGDWVTAELTGKPHIVAIYRADKWKKITP